MANPGTTLLDDLDEDALIERLMQGRAIGAAEAELMGPHIRGWWQGKTDQRTFG